MEPTRPGQPFLRPQTPPPPVPMCQLTAVAKPEEEPATHQSTSTAFRTPTCACNQFYYTIHPSTPVEYKLQCTSRPDEAEFAKHGNFGTSYLRQTLRLDRPPQASLSRDNKHISNYGLRGTLYSMLHYPRGRNQVFGPNKSQIGYRYPRQPPCRAVDDSTGRQSPLQQDFVLFC